MNHYSIPDAIVFLATEYGTNKMPSSEETLRRAIRTKQLVAQEEGDPGRKGYTISEENLRAYAESRIKRSSERLSKQSSQKGILSIREMTASPDDLNPIQFPELFSRYIDGKISSSEYYKELYNQRMAWENIMHEKQNTLARLSAQEVALQTDIQSCQSAIDAYNDGISKYNP